MLAFSSLFRGSVNKTILSGIKVICASYSVVVAQKAINQGKDDLSIYEKYLIKHNESIKKPHQKLRTEEERIITNYLKDKRYSQVITFMFNNINRSLCYDKSAEIIDEQLANNYSALSSDLQILAAHTLIHFRETKTFNAFKSSIDPKLQNKDLNKLNSEELVVFLGGSIIQAKNTKFLNKIYAQKTKNHKEMLQNVYINLQKRKLHRNYQNQQYQILTYLGLLLDRSLNNKKKCNKLKQQSNLEKNVQTFLKVLQLDYSNEQQINNYYVDFLVQRKQGDYLRQYILEVNGNYHYTLQGKLKGKQIIRNLILNQYCPLRIIHYNDLMKSKGHRNKLAYIQSLFEEPEINWESEQKGFDSQWQVKIEDQLLKQIQ